MHKSSKHYDVNEFLQGGNTLDDVIIKEVGDVRGKSMLHLMCHFGLDTLSWARLGADVTGVDFSERAIELARELAKKAQIEARFICSDVYALDDVLAEEFDLVFTSDGVINWLHDLRAWANIIASHLRSGGSFYIREIHPFSYIFDDDCEDYVLKVRDPYFEVDRPLEFEGQESYTDRFLDISLKSYEWPHSVSDIINSLIGAGLVIESFNEFPYSCYRSLPFMREYEKGKWWLPEKKRTIPFLFSIKARKK